MAAQGSKGGAPSGDRDRGNRRPGGKDNRGGNNNRKKK
jgi:hypothetical protein